MGNDSLNGGFALLENFLPVAHGHIIMIPRIHRPLQSPSAHVQLLVVLHRFVIVVKLTSKLEDTFIVR